MSLAGPDELFELPIFPLPHVVFFPGTVLPLHIFEPRYKKMIRESLDGDRRIGMVLLRSDSRLEAKEEQRVHQIGGMGVISDYEELEEGRYNILLRGIGRFRIVEIIPHSPYQIARVQVLLDPHEEGPGDALLFQQILSRFEDLVEGEEPFSQHLSQLKEADFKTLVNAVCSLAPISPRDRQVLLEMDSLGERAESILAVVSALAGQKRMIADFIHLRPDDSGRN